MRIWSIHPKYLDRQGLIALWRETLLAQKVLAGGTKGYKHHPQLIRFREAHDPLLAIGNYLSVIVEEAVRRGYLFDHTKILRTSQSLRPIAVSSGQLRYEFDHLLRKLQARDPELCKQWQTRKRILPHPSFYSIHGDVHEWEKR